MSLVIGEDAHDVFQKTFTTAWQHFDDLPPGAESERKWLFGVVRNHCNNARRTTRRADALVAAIEHGRPKVTVESGEQNLDPIEVSILIQALKELNEEDCEMMVLTGWLEMTPAELADMLEQPSGTVRSRLSRARKKLAMRFAQLSEDGDPT